MNFTSAHYQALSAAGITMEQFAEYMEACEDCANYGNDVNFTPAELVQDVQAAIEVMGL